MAAYLKNLFPDNTIEKELSDVIQILTFRRPFYTMIRSEHSLKNTSKVPCLSY